MSGAASCDRVLAFMLCFGSRERYSADRAARICGIGNVRSRLGMCAETA